MVYTGNASYGTLCPKLCYVTVPRKTNHLNTMLQPYDNHQINSSRTATVVTRIIANLSDSWRLQSLITQVNAILS